MAAGCDRITAEYLKRLPSLLEIFYLESFRNFLQSKYILHNGRYILIKDILMTQINYREPTIAAVMTKLYSLILMGKLTEYIEDSRINILSRYTRLICQPVRLTRIFYFRLL